MQSISKKLIILFASVILLVVLTGIYQTPAFSYKNTLPSITVINLIRGIGLGHEKDNLLESLKAQWQITKQENIDATWLWQYGALEDASMVSYAKSNMPRQEFGLLLEIDRSFAKAAGVTYKGQGPSYFSDGLLLSSYDISERRKFIDTAFLKFKQVFGYYPKTVGAWWIGADSIYYMQKKYGIVAVLKASEQFNVDVYSIWGTPWSIPYLPSKENEGLPADSWDNSLKVTLLQWAARDPMQGYKNGGYSTQDFDSIGYGTSYFEYLSSIYLNKPLDNIVIGLENGGTLATFKGHYLTVLSEAKKLESEKKASIQLAKDYATDFLSAKTAFPGTKYFLTKSFNSNDQSFWYNSVNYRAGIFKTGDNVYLIDLRNYANKVSEDFLVLPNSQGYLRINEPEIIDSMRNPGQKILIASVSGEMSLERSGNTITLQGQGKTIAVFTPDKFSIKQTQKSYTFSANTQYFNIFDFLIILYSVYFVLIYWQGKNLKSFLVYFLVSIIPLITAYTFLFKGTPNDILMLFDSKELFLFKFFPVITGLSILNNLFILEIIPFILVLISHYLLVIKYPQKVNTAIYFFIVIISVLVFAHIPYFPLNKTSLLYILLFFVVFVFLISFLTMLVFIKYKFKNIFKYLAVSVLCILVFASITILFSRSGLVLTSFELNALQFIKDQQKEVIFVYESDYSIKPIYRAERPLISYDDYSFVQKLTGVSWQMVVRPANHILKLSDYNNKLIVVPRFLGADISPDEENQLKLKKIFDNAQIAIFEKS